MILLLLLCLLGYTLYTHTQKVYSYTIKKKNANADILATMNIDLYIIPIPADSVRRVAATYYINSGDIEKKKKKIRAKSFIHEMLA